APVKRTRSSPARPTVFRQTSFRPSDAHDPRGTHREAVQRSIRQLLLSSAVKRARRQTLPPDTGPASPWPARHPVADHPENDLRLVLPLPPSINHQYATVQGDRKSTRLNSSHQIISYAVFCLKKKNIEEQDASTTSYVRAGT